MIFSTLQCFFRCERLLFRIVLFWFSIITKVIYRCHDFVDCFSSCTEEVAGLSGCDVKEEFRFNLSTIETSNPLRLAKLIM